MTSVAKRFSTSTWVRSPFSSDFRFNNGTLNSDGNSSNYSSEEEPRRIDKKYVPSFMLNDDLNGRSYVDPWDMENYSFLRRQLQDISLSDNELSGNAAFESTQSDFYYVPLDSNGSPQYQYKHYIDSDAGRDGIRSPLVFTNDSCGLFAGIDEHDFFNEYLDTPHPSLQSGVGEVELSNPSRQSERSRFNNQDYQTYKPPSMVVKDVAETRSPRYKPRYERNRRNSGRRSLSDLHLNDLILETPAARGVVEDRSRSAKKDFDLDPNRRCSSEVKLNLNRRKSFHDWPPPPVQPARETEPEKPTRRRRSALDHCYLEEKRTPLHETDPPEYRKKEKQLTRRKSIHEITTEIPKISKIYKTQKPARRYSLRNCENTTDNGETYANLPVVNKPYLGTYLSKVPDSSLVYVYETAKRRRKMVLPNPSPEYYGQYVDTRYSTQDAEDSFNMDPIETYINRPLSRYTMTNYGHLKIDYSCSWNCLDRYIAHRVRI